MPLTSTQIQLIKQSWKSLRGINPELIADIFYTKLFNDNSRLRKMFPADMQLQYRKLMDMLTAIVTRLHKLDEMCGEIAAMARRHESYGVKPKHYALVGSALMWTLQTGLGANWNKETADAWSACYIELTNLMLHPGQNSPKEKSAKFCD